MLLLVKANDRVYLLIMPIWPRGTRLENLFFISASKHLTCPNPAWRKRKLVRSHKVRILLRETKTSNTLVKSRPPFDALFPNLRHNAKILFNPYLVYPKTVTSFHLRGTRYSIYPLAYPITWLRLSNRQSLLTNKGCAVGSNLATRSAFFLTSVCAG